MDLLSPESAYCSLFVLSFLASTVLPFGSEWFLVTLLRNDYSPFFTVTVATVGNTLGAFTTYALGYWGGRVLLSRVLRASPTTLERAHRFYTRYGVWVLLLSWAPIIGDVLCGLGGLFRTAWWLFLILVLLGKLSRYLFIAWTSASLPT